MGTMKTIAVALAAVLAVNLCVSSLAWAQGHTTTAIPTHEPQTWAAAEQPLPTVATKKVSTWTWVILIALLGGVAAAAGAGGGGGDDGGSSSGDGGDTGSYTGTW
jgi:hypothetical protein